MAELCTSYTTYVTSADQKTVAKIVEELRSMSDIRKKKGITFEKYSGNTTTSRVYVLQGIDGTEAAKLGLIPFGGKGGGWLVPLHKVPTMRYYAATGIILPLDRDSSEVDDKKFFDQTLNKMAKVGLMYSSLRPVDRGVFDDVFQHPPGKAMPEPHTYRTILSYVNSKRTEHTFFPPRIYTEVLELAGRIKRDMEGTLTFNYSEARTGSGIVVLVGCKGVRLNRTRDIMSSKVYPNAREQDYPDYDTTIIRYAPDID